MPNLMNDMIRPAARLLDNLFRPEIAAIRAANDKPEIYAIARSSVDPQQVKALMGPGSDPSLWVDHVVRDGTAAALLRLIELGGRSRNAPDKEGVRPSDDLMIDAFNTRDTPLWSETIERIAAAEKLGVTFDEKARAAASLQAYEIVEDSDGRWHRTGPYPFGVWEGVAEALGHFPAPPNNSHTPA